MIDIENELFTKLETRLRSEYYPQEISVYGEYVRVPALFPSVIITESDNYVLERTQTGTEVENHAIVVYEINVYSNKEIGKKSECKKIFKIIDEEIGELGFTRIMLNPVPNFEDSTIYRMTGRYRAVVSLDKIIYRR